MDKAAPWDEVRRQLEICNACRYCEGYCAVFPAIERRRDFEQRDMLYLAHLCHDCRNCYTACMYAPPHEFGVNIPESLSEVRLVSYAEYTSPRALSAVFRKQRAAVTGTALAAVVVVLLVALLTNGVDKMTSAHTGSGAFYVIFPYLTLIIPSLAISLYGILLLIRGLLHFWRDTGSPHRPRVGGRALLEAAGEALILRWLRGGGAGCDYPHDHGSSARAILHSCMFYGLVSAFLSTVLAAIWQDILGIQPPFAVGSAPVLFGIAGGAGLMVGTTGLLYLKLRSKKAPSYGAMTVADYAFLILLDLVSLSGMLLLVLRNSRAMGLLLTLHLGLILGLFLTAPYGKFVHFVYRYLALVQNRLEEGQERDAEAQS